MRVVMRWKITGTRNGEDWPNAGESIDLPDAEAADLIAGGLATPAEKAAAPAAEKAAAPKPRAGKKPAPETR